MTSKKMSITALALTLVLLVILGGMTAYLDPFFHYHAPWDWQNYSLYDERYQNEGITRHFEYDALITGTSMTENFKASEFDELFGVQSVKVPFSGASYKEINEFISRTISRNPDLRIIIRGLDTNLLLTDKDWMRYDSYPEYLYDDNILNDVNYIFNKDIFVDHTWYAMEYARSGKQSVDFDIYANWNRGNTFGKETVMATYSRNEKAGKAIRFSVQDEEVVKATFQQNVVDLVRDNPQIDFYLFFTPYSILYWDFQNQQGNVERLVEAQRVAIEMMLQYENVHLFSFFDEFEMICDLGNYKDIAHYGENVNSQMLQWMSKGEHRLTLDNYEEYLTSIKEFYTQFPYDSLFES